MKDLHINDEIDALVLLSALRIAHETREFTRLTPYQYDAQVRRCKKCNKLEIR